MDISVVVPTKDRAADLKKCVTSILAQTVLLEEIIIVDDGNLSVDFAKDMKNRIESSNMQFQYIKKDIPGLSVSRNIGAANAKNSIVLFLDDDVVLDRDYIKVLKNDWENHRHEKQLGGIGGIIKNMRKVTFMEELFHKIFLLSSPVKWDVTNVGFQVWTTNMRIEEKVFYLPGGITSFKRSLLKEITFRQLSPGRTPGDEVEFFMKAKKAGYYFILDPRAKLFHKETPVAREDNFERGLKEGYNQYIIFEDNVEKNFKNCLRFFWSSTGWILRQFFAGHIIEGLGMIAGYLKVLTKKKKEITGETS